MSANFYNSSGRMVGIDMHDYQGILPPDPAPISGYALSCVKATFDGACLLCRGLLAHGLASGNFER